MQGPGSRLASLAARRAVLVDDLGWKVRILPNFARFFCQFNRALLDFLLSPFFVRKDASASSATLSPPEWIGIFF